MLNVIALVALVATLLGFVALQILGSHFGFNGSNNGFAWIELGIGLFATISLAAFGTVLGMLCAIFDNQRATMQRLANAPAENGLTKAAD